MFWCSLKMYTVRFVTRKKQARVVTKLPTYRQKSTKTKSMNNGVSINAQSPSHSH